MVWIGEPAYRQNSEEQQMAQKHVVMLRRMTIWVLTIGLGVLLIVWSWPSLAGSAILSVTPEHARQNETVTLSGEGFVAGEAIAIWITYPDYRVYGVAETTADDQGRFAYPYLPDFLGATFTPTGNYTYTAHGKSSGLEAYADLFVDIGVAPGVTPAVQLTVDRTSGPQGSVFTFLGSGYAAGESVAFWIRYPDNSVSDVGRSEADSAGTVAFALKMNGAPAGGYALTGRGINSGANGIAEFEVTPGDLISATGVANLLIEPGPDTQRNYATFAGSGFQPGETVSIWVTLADYSTRPIGEVTIGTSGTFRAILYLSEQEPTGLRTYTAYGNASGLRATAEYALNPGGAQPDGS
jgi:hypothetical protein